MNSRVILRVVVAVVLAVIAVGTAVAVITDGDVTDQQQTSTDVPSTGLDPEQAGRAFLSSYVDPDGRVVRRDQGDDTVSEGQAYAMLVAVAVGDRATFDKVWDWTQLHLSRPDGTLSWLWADGGVSDESSAADADLDAARALVLAGRTFGDVDLTAAGVTLGKAVLDVETVPIAGGRILVAGNWARTEPFTYNPSYASPAAFDLLDQASADSRWGELLAGSRAVTTSLLAGGRLPPDWAQVRADGTAVAVAGPDTRDAKGIRYSYDATRTPIRYAESCHPEDTALAAGLQQTFASRSGSGGLDTWSDRGLDGAALGTDSSVVAAAGQAAAAAAAGQGDQARNLLLAGDRLQQSHPTYYGAAWDALGRLMLQTDRLGGCPPLR